MLDGLEVLRRQFSLGEVASLIATTALWVDRQTFEYLPVWYPEEARKDPMYKASWTAPLHNTNRTTGETVHKRVGNTNANKALSAALGLKLKERPNWTCCHIWSVDDPRFQKPNTVASDKRYYSCVANMVLLPTPLKAFTDAMPEIRSMLRVASAAYFGWSVDDPDVPPIDDERESCNWNSYPSGWPRCEGDAPPKGVVQFCSRIQKRADQRLEKLASDMATAGQYYPRREVRDVLTYWALQVPSFESRGAAVVARCQ